MRMTDDDLKCDIIIESFRLHLAFLLLQSLCLLRQREKVTAVSYEEKDLICFVACKTACSFYVYARLTLKLKE